MDWWRSEVVSGLSGLNFKTSYHKGRDDIAKDFYLPAMRCARDYDRAVGFFRSAAFIIAWPALREFVGHGGHMRILCSQVLSADDVEALDAGYTARVDETFAARLRNEVESLLADEAMGAPARVLAALVAIGVLEFKIAILRHGLRSSPPRIFHDKLGILRDQEGFVVIFKGSMNETWSGLASDGNLESVDVACSWLGGRDLERTREESKYFADLWCSVYPGLDVRPFPDTARELLVSAADADWEGTVQRLLEEQARPPGDSATVWDAKGRTLKPHQAAGLAAWETNGRAGILAFATGAGKTFTALHAIRDSLRQGEIPVVVVPDITLFTQWGEELSRLAEFCEARILRVGAGNSYWREVIRDWTAPDGAPRIILATVQVARSDSFRGNLTPGAHLFLVADEVHRLGSPTNQALLDERVFGPRLGLSATPERAGDPAGTAVILSYFRGVLEPRYTLADAVRDNVLAHYFYRPHTVGLTADESADWQRISRRIAQLHSRSRMSGLLDEQIEKLLFARARIIKQATAKVPLAIEVLGAEYVRGQRWIVYCDDQDQLGAVVAALARAGYTAMPYHSAMEGDRVETLRWLDRFGGIVVAIKCLDEGVDIPSVTHALILASAKNPREFIQRRGRVLRTAPNKTLAYIHDAIVVPPRTFDADEDGADPITAGELARAIEFAGSADNPAAGADLEAIAIDAGIDWEALTQAGVEDLDDD